MAFSGVTRLRPTAPHKTLYNRFIRWSRLGVLDRIFAALAAEGGPPERLMVDSTHLLQRQHPCRNRHLLAWAMRPEPKQAIGAA